MVGPLQDRRMHSLVNYTLQPLFLKKITEYYHVPAIPLVYSNIWKASHGWHSVTFILTAEIEFALFLRNVKYKKDNVIMQCHIQYDPFGSDMKKTKAT